MARPGRLLGVLLGAALGSLLLASPARADYRLCNRTSYVLEGAIALQADPKEPRSDWHSQGWARMLPGSCASALAGPIRGGSYYVFARSADVHQGPTKYFSGNESFCTLPKDFALTGRDNCALRGYESNDFIKVETKPGDDWTTTFSEPRDFSLDEARVAGAQRLLRDNGFRVPKIDGIASKATLRTLMAFERASGRNASTTIDEALLSALVDGAEKEQAGTGLSICNRTRHLAWAAVGFRTEDDEMSSGWIRVEPGQCAKAIKGKLTEKEYAVYAEAVDERGNLARENGRLLVWSGAETYCTKTTRFEIKGRDSCATRGYDERKFMRIDNRAGAARIDVPLE